MTSRSRRKRPTTAPSTPQSAKRTRPPASRLPDRLAPLVVCGLSLLISQFATLHACATELNPPATINVPENARAIGTAGPAAASRQISTEANVRWARTVTRRLGEKEAWQRKSGVSQAALVSAAGSSAADAISKAGGTTRSDNLSSFVRPASEVAPIDPLDDPFGDKENPTSGPEIPINSPQQSAATAEPANPSPALPASPLPAPAPSPEPPRAESQAPVFPSPSNGTNSAYNGRNCAEELGSCRVARDFVSSGSIRQISLDITPALTVAQLDGQGDRDYQQELEITLARAGSRVSGSSRECRRRRTIGRLSIWSSLDHRCRRPNAQNPLLDTQ